MDFDHYLSRSATPSLIDPDPLMETNPLEDCTAIFTAGSVRRRRSFARHADLARTGLPAGCKSDVGFVLLGRYEALNRKGLAPVVGRGECPRVPAGLEKRWLTCEHRRRVCFAERCPAALAVVDKVLWWPRLIPRAPPAHGLEQVLRRVELTNVLSWAPYVPLAPVLWILLVGPGYLVARVLGVRRYVAMVTGPGLTLALVGVFGEVLHAVGWNWNLWSFLGCLTVLTALTLILRALGSVNWLAAINSYVFQPNPPSKSDRKLCVLAIVGAALIPIVGMLFLSDPNAPSSQADPMFHYSAVNAITHTGDGSGHAVALTYGLEPTSVRYPTVWHAFISLVAAYLPLMPTAHTFNYLVIPVVWVTGLVFFYRLLLPHSPRAVALATLFNVTIPYYPDFVNIARGYWPNVISLASLPVILGLCLLIWRTALAKGNWPGTAIGLVWVVVILGGMGLAHPGALFAAVSVLIFPAAALLYRAWAKRRSLARSSLALQLLISGGLLLFTAALFAHPRARSFLMREHPHDSGWAGKIQTFNSVFGHLPTALIIAGFIAVILAALLVGHWMQVAYMKAGFKWLVAALVFQIALVVGCYFPGIGISHISGLWYHDPKRVMVVVLVLAAPVFAFWCDRTLRPRCLGAGLVVVALAVAAVGIRVPMIYPQASPPMGPERILKSPEHLHSIQTLYTHVPAGSIVIGDPVSGLGYAPAYGPINSVFSQVNYVGGDWYGKYLIDYFSHIHVNDQVCELVRHYGIGYYYESEPFVFQKRNRLMTWPGMYDVDTSEGFTLIHEDDGGRLWKIDACGPVSPEAEAGWWDVSKRHR